jgi:hypothetical protein
MKPSSVVPVSRAHLAVVLAISMAALLLSVPAARACDYTGARQVFSPWGDQHHYVLGPDGGFEAGGLGWSLRGGAKAVAGNETFRVNDPDDSRSLALPAGSSATSPPVCMSLDTPIFRLFARNGGDPDSRLRVEAVYRLLGLLRTKTISTVTATRAWAPTKQMSTVLTLSTIVGTLVPSSINIRITPLDRLGDWRVDDLYIDPFARR